MSLYELKECPFCGSDNVRMLYINDEIGETYVDTDEELNDKHISAFIHCYGCSTEIFPHEAEKPIDVIEAWNTRKRIDRIVEQSEEIRDTILNENDVDNKIVNWCLEYVDDIIEIIKHCEVTDTKP